METGKHNENFKEDYKDRDNYQRRQKRIRKAKGELAAYVNEQVESETNESESEITFKDVKLLMQSNLGYKF